MTLLLLLLALLLCCSADGRDAADDGPLLLLFADAITGAVCGFEDDAARIADDDDLDELERGRLEITLVVIIGIGGIIRSPGAGGVCC